MAPGVPQVGMPTTSVSLTAPDFTIKLPHPRPKRQEPTSTRTTGAPRGLLTIDIKEARGLHVASRINSRPYVVVQFDKNEFIGAEFECPEVVPDGAAAGNAAGATSEHPRWNHLATFDVTIDNQPVYLSVYDRRGDDEELLGTREIYPRLIHRSSSDQWYDIFACDAEESEEPAVRGQIRVQMAYERLPPRKLCAGDFEFLKLIGRGTFGRVFQVRKRDTKRIYAMKVLSKREIALKKEVTHTMGERKILEKSLDCPFLVGLKFSFQTETELFFVTDYKSGGELFWHLQREGRFTEERARFYIAELILALEHLHKYDIVYRDLKPENILLDATGHVALCDFGLSKADLGAGQLTNTFCGTTEYLAPEILLDESGYSKLVDFWSLGVLLFEMCCGWSPFYAEDTQQMYRNICFGKIKFPRGAISDDGKQFVKGLLNRNPKHRLGAQNDAQDLKEHAFFKDIDWDLLARKQIPPMFKPLVESDESVANFDPEFTNSSQNDVARFNLEYERPSLNKTHSAETVPQHAPEHDGGRPSRSYGAEAHEHPGGMRASDAPYGKAQDGSRTHAEPIKKPQPRGSVADAPEPEPLSDSIQEKFRGFSYTGSYDENSFFPQGRMGCDDEDEEDEAEDPDEFVMDMPVRQRDPSLDLSSLSLGRK